MHSISTITICKNTFKETDQIYEIRFPLSLLTFYLMFHHFFLEHLFKWLEIDVMLKLLSLTNLLIFFT
jgi:hypothetical protein